MSLAASRKWWAFRYSSTASKVLFFSSRCEAYLERRDLISFMLWVLVSSTALFHCKETTTLIEKKLLYILYQINVTNTTATGKGNDHQAINEPLN